MSRIQLITQLSHPYGNRRDTGEFAAYNHLRAEPIMDGIFGTAGTDEAAYRIVTKAEIAAWKSREASRKQAMSAIISDPARLMACEELAESLSVDSWDVYHRRLPLWADS